MLIGPLTLAQTNKSIMVNGANGLLIGSGTNLFKDNLDISGAAGMQYSNNNSKTYLHGTPPTIWSDATGYASTSTATIVKFTNTTENTLIITNIGGTTYFLIPTNGFGFSNGASVGGVGITSNTAASATFTPGVSTNGLTFWVTNVNSRSILYFPFGFSGSNATMGFIISNNTMVATNAIFSAGTNYVTGVLKVEVDPNEITLISNIVTSTGSSWWNNVKGRTR